MLVYLFTADTILFFIMYVICYICSFRQLSFSSHVFQSYPIEFRHFIRSSPRTSVEDDWHRGIKQAFEILNFKVHSNNSNNNNKSIQFLLDACLFVVINKRN